jgi:ATP-dependent Clp protease protease subunit
VDIDIEAREIIRMRERLNRMIARETGQTYEKVAIDCDRNYWLGAEEAIAYGIADKVIRTAAEMGG